MFVEVGFGMGDVGFEDVRFRKIWEFYDAPVVSGCRGGDTLFCFSSCL